MGIRIYNTLSRRKEEFITEKPGVVGMYSCGPTVYDYFHIGNARAFVVPDVIRRYLAYRGYKVTLVQNITDIDDKIIKRAAERGVATHDIVEEFTEAYFHDREALGVGAPDVQPRATEHVPDIISMIGRLIERGFAYERDGDVYFDVSAFPGYGSLSGQSVDGLKAGARVEVGGAKDDPLDFTLWKAAKPGEPFWESPWGPGRPGWHIECSVMSSKYLGTTFDIHTGGVDLVFPHHENEVAQSTGANGVKPVRYWVHNGYVNIDGQRMGKSLGNFKTVRDILKLYPGKVVRYFLISNHYRKPINFSDEELRMCAKALGRLEGAIANSLAWAGLRPDDLDSIRPWGKAPMAEAGSPEAALDNACTDARAKFEESMDDDFNSAGAIGSLHDLATAINSYANAGTACRADDDVTRGTVARAALTMIELGQVLGIVEPGEIGPSGMGWDASGQDGQATGATGATGATSGSASERGASVDQLMELIMQVRAKARAAKQYELSDMIRDGLGDLGIVIEDTRDGARWKLGAK
ncbi:MAG: cysteine--tRNA ligase [Clostridia bacterium]|nr:cysteine--tRNA ligase [Clostridia bacterium]